MKKLIFKSMIATLMTIPILTSCAAPKTQPNEIVNIDQGNTQGKILRIYAWNEEFKSRLDSYFGAKMPSDIKVEWVITPNPDNAYQNKLDEALLQQKNLPVDQKIDLYLVEADYALKYVDTEYSLDVIKDVGLTPQDVAGQYQYTKEIASTKDGVLKAVSWQATPGLLAYRRSIAKDVLGTDDPVEVQKKLSTWEQFDTIAEEMKNKGYKMISGFGDTFRTFSNNVTTPWVDSNGKITIDDNLFRWVDQTKEYTDRGYTNKTNMWTTEWSADQGPNSKVFGFFYPTWGINFTLLGNSLDTPISEGGKLEVGNGIFGDWAVTEGPQSYYWGGSWLVAAPGTDNIDVIRDIMKTLTCDKETMKQMTLDTEDYTNNVEAMNELANSDYKSEFLGGQNHIALFAEAAPKISLKYTTAYDQGLVGAFQRSFEDYFNGKVDKETALSNFYKDATEVYPELTY